MEKISDLILYKDHHLIAINKPAGLPTQKDKSGEANAHQLIMAYAHRDIYVVHRLDQRVSGVLLFTKSKNAAAELARQWKENFVKKTYYGIVPIADIPSEGTLTHYLTYDHHNNITTSHAERLEKSDESILEYKVIKHLDNFMVLEINLLTGRKHQIRSQLSAIGIPIKGDIKYGSKRTNEYNAIDLHAYSISFLHPSNGKLFTITAPFPEEGLWNLVELKDKS
ncbi:MAG: RluA family pseudouridine synthase [Bacteroidota bacterium]|nr:RluA family pseudouridine synthase [Bacteroidota bacterium]